MNTFTVRALGGIVPPPEKEEKDISFDDLIPQKDPKIKDTPPPLPDGYRILSPKGNQVDPYPGVASEDSHHGR